MWGRWRRRAKREDAVEGAEPHGRRERAPEPTLEPERQGLDRAEPNQRAFAEYFSVWGLFLPHEAVAARRAGYLIGKGWSVRWRWVDGGGSLGSGDGTTAGDTVEFLASHRMTNERWHRIASDGTLSAIEVPFEAMVFPADASDEQRAEIERDYRAGWSAHIAAVEAAGMNPIQGRPPIPGDLPGPDLQTWMLDGGDWRSAPLLATG